MKGEEEEEGGYSYRGGGRVLLTWRRKVLLCIIYSSCLIATAILPHFMIMDYRSNISQAVDKKERTWIKISN